MGLRVPVAAPVHTNAHNWYPHHSAPQNQVELCTPVAVSTSAHVLSRCGRGHQNSQGIFRAIAKDEHNGLQLNYAQRSQNYVFPSEDIVSQQPQLLIPGRTSENGIYIDKGQNSHETNGIVGVQIGMQAANLATQKNLINQEQQIAWKNSGQIEQSQEAVHPIHGVQVIYTPPTYRMPQPHGHGTAECIKVTFWCIQSGQVSLLFLRQVFMFQLLVCRASHFLKRHMQFQFQMLLQTMDIVST
jgi:hypothetical protein